MSKTIYSIAITISFLIGVASVSAQQYPTSYAPTGYYHYPTYRHIPYYPQYPSVYSYQVQTYTSPQQYYYYVQPTYTYPQPQPYVPQQPCIYQYNYYSGTWYPSCRY